MTIQDILTAVMDKVVKPLHQRFTGNDKGDLSGLKTRDKSHFVAALNEVKSQLDELEAKVLPMEEEFRDKKKVREEGRFHCCRP